LLLRVGVHRYFESGRVANEAGLPPGLSKCVLIAAPHTSNWDFVYLLLAAFALRLNIYWMGKASLFAGPFGPIMRWLGGIAVNREQSGNLVSASVAALKDAQGPVQLVVPPKAPVAACGNGRPGFTTLRWAQSCPSCRRIWISARSGSVSGPVFHPTGDIERDMPLIQAFYAPMQGKIPSSSSKALRLKITMQRFTISLQDELAEQFDAWIAHRGYENRSEAVRDMLRAELEQRPSACGAVTALCREPELRLPLW